MISSCHFCMGFFVSHQQRTRLMERNQDFAKSFTVTGINAREAHKMKWDKLSKILNASGPPTKTPKEWQRIWTTRKYNVKKKLIANKKSIFKTGGGAFVEFPLDSVEESIVQSCGIEAAVAGISGVSSFGCGEEDLDMQINEILSEAVIADPEEPLEPAITHVDPSVVAKEIPAEPTEGSTKFTKKRTEPKTAECILLSRKQVELQENFLMIQKGIKDSLNSIDTSIKELADCIKTFCSETEKERQTSMALKKEELKLKRMELELAQAVNSLRIKELTK